jgi:hypothetical protein
MRVPGFVAFGEATQLPPSYVAAARRPVELPALNIPQPAAGVAQLPATYALHKGGSSEEASSSGMRLAARELVPLLETGWFRSSFARATSDPASLLILVAGAVTTVAAGAGFAALVGAA